MRKGGISQPRSRNEGEGGMKREAGEGGVKEERSHGGGGGGEEGGGEREARSERRTKGVKGEPKE